MTFSVNHPLLYLLAAIPVAAVLGQSDFASMKKFVCLDVPKPNNIMRHESNSEHSTPLATFPRGAGCKIQHIDCKIIFGNKM